MKAIVYTGPLPAGSIVAPGGAEVQFTAGQPFEVTDELAELLPADEFQPANEKETQ
jgi:hypothetical protein